MGKRKTTKQGKKGSSAELLVQGVLEDQGFFVHRAAATGMVKFGSRWAVKSHDLWGCIDLAAIKPDGIWFCQVTTDGKRSARRRKIENLAGFWPKAARVSIVSHVTEGEGRARKHFLKVEDYLPGGIDARGVITPDEWMWRERIEFDAKLTEANRKMRAKLARLAKKQAKAKMDNVKATPRFIECRNCDGSGEYVSCGSSDFEDTRLCQPCAGTGKLEVNPEDS